MISDSIFLFIHVQGVAGKVCIQYWFMQGQVFFIGLLELLNQSQVIFRLVDGSICTPILPLILRPATLCPLIPYVRTLGQVNHALSQSPVAC